MTRNTQDRVIALIPRLTRVAGRYAGNSPADREDAVQEMTLFLLRNIDGIRHDGAAIRFALQKVLNISISEGRRSARTSSIEADHDAIGADPEADDAFAAVDARVDVRRALDQARLDPDARAGLNTVVSGYETTDESTKRALRRARERALSALAANLGAA